MFQILHLLINVIIDLPIHLTQFLLALLIYLSKDSFCMLVCSFIYVGFFTLTILLLFCVSFLI